MTYPLTAPWVDGFDDCTLNFEQLASMLPGTVAVNVGTFTGNGTGTVNPTPAIKTGISNVKTLLGLFGAPNPNGPGGAYGATFSPVAVAPGAIQFRVDATGGGSFTNAVTYWFYWAAIG